MRKAMDRKDVAFTAALSGGSFLKNEPELSLLNEYFRCILL